VRDWSQHAKVQPRQVMALRWEEGRIRRRMAHLRGLLGIPEPDDDR
jgi:hypothetical protein